MGNNNRAQARFALQPVPADPGVAHADLPRRCPEAQGAEQTLIRFDQVAHLRPRQRTVAEVVVTIDEAVP